METFTLFVGALGGLITLVGFLYAIFKWFEKQEKQDKDIAGLKEELTMISYCMSACLDGLEQLGANHTVPVAKDKLSKFLNQKAHQ